MQALKLNKHEILKHVPHRPPFLFIDRVVDLRPGKSIQALFYLDPAADYFQGHFPNHHVMPGSLMLEALAQATCVLFDITYPSKRKRRFYAGSVKARFLKVVQPGCELELNSKVISMVSKGGVYDVWASINGMDVLRGEMGCMCVYE
ncbi:3-hydroxyacyl-[acyl-carrier-protein] dehydratase FabZ [Candidatus Uhrbacteria bacterium]|nr:3-hydroxyacyl-[acyl-carrier-protein] dehydratase FabZ [Candidatus Uhrbacteria bacterium]